MSKEPDQDRLLDHNYDGIQEYDNPMPRWWLWIFYASILYSVLYLLNVPGIGIGRGRIAAYERDVEAARAKYAQIQPPTSELSEAALLALTKDRARLDEGKNIFVATCAPCHRPDGGGNIGPNLTDEYWIHGGRPLQILQTVNQGVPDKGMPAWGQVLKPEQLPAVAAFVISLRGTNPPEPKAPQGTKEEVPEHTH